MKNLLTVSVFLALIGMATRADAQAVSITSSTTGQRITTELVKRVRVELDRATVGSGVWVLELPLTSSGGDPCPTGLTAATKRGTLFALASQAGHTQSKEYGSLRGLYGATGSNGTLCAMLDSGSTPQTLYLSFY